MRVLYCNKYNYRFSGTEVYLFELMDLMRANGHEVALFSMADERGEPTPYDRHFVPHIDFKGQMSWQEKVRGAAHVIYSTEARRRIRAMIKEFRPDVAHIRSIYHHLSPSILWELRAQNIPVLYHLNDFKLLCPNYNFVSRGLACEMCKGCYPGGAARATLVAEAYLHHWFATYRKCVDLFLAPSCFVRDKFVEHGWNSELFEVLSHFQNIHAICEPPKDGPILYFGRLSSEKGVDDLIRAMPQVPHVDLVIAGDGPRKNELERLAIELRLANVKFVGHLGPEERDRQIARSRFTVLPSHAYETLGKTILESYAHARPVIASDIGSRRELLHDGETGLLYRAGNVNQLAETIHFLAMNPEMTKQMGRAGWEMVRRDHTPERHYQKIMCLYDQLLAAKPKRSRPKVFPTE